MEQEIKLLTDRINDLENQVVRLNRNIYYKEQKISLENKANSVTYLFFIPVIALILLFLGTNYSYQTDKHQISYTNKGSLELALSGLTLVSGLYSLKKHRDKQELARNNFEA